MVCALSLGKQLLWTWSRRGETLCPWPVLSLGGQSHSILKGSGQSHLLVCPGGKGSVLYEHESGSATSWAQAQPQSIFASTDPEPSLCVLSPPPPCL